VELAKVVQQGRGLITTVQGKIQTLQHDVADALVDIGVASERMNPLRRQVEECDRAAAWLTAAAQAGKTATARCAELTASCDEQKESIEAVAVDAEQKIGQLDTRNAEAAHMLKELSEVNSIGLTVAEKVRQAAAGAETSADVADRAALEAEEQSVALSSAKESCAQAVEQLEASVESAKKHQSALNILTIDAESVIGRLNSHNAAARQVTHELAETNRASHELIRKSDESALASKEAVEGAREAIDHLAKEVTEAATKTELNSGQLNDQNTRSEDIIEQLTERVERASSSAETSETLMREFLVQAQKLQSVLEGLRKKAGDLEASVSQATVEPREIITEAQAQTAQLERVCTTVRKVFAGLAQVTLEAKTQVQELRGTSGQASDRLNQLTQETERASETLREWVGEASRVQMRLDTTLEQCPSIHETHPGETLDGLGQVAKPIPRIVNRSAMGEQILAHTPAPVANVQSEQGVPVANALTPSAKVEEIAQLIQEAKGTVNRAAK
jgi:chromosome segregation ATPase